MKRFLFMLLGITYLLIMIGCSKSNTNYFSDTELPQQSLISDPKEAKPTESNPLSDNSISGDFADFTEEEIDNAKKVAEAYYKETSFIVGSIEYDITNTLYKQYSADYEKQNLITFTVKIKRSENPPRGIVLKRKDLNSNWEVLDEGY
jgi:hypothetical protein